MKTEEIEEAAKKYLKTLPGINYRSLYDFGTQQQSAFTKGAEWYKEYSDQTNKSLLDELEKVNKINDELREQKIELQDKIIDWEQSHTIFCRIF